MFDAVQTLDYITYMGSATGAAELENNMDNENQVAAVLIEMAQGLKNVKCNAATGKFNGNAIHAFLQKARKELVACRRDQRKRRHARDRNLYGRSPARLTNPARKGITWRCIMFEKLKSIWHAYLAACREPPDIEDSAW